MSISSYTCLRYIFCWVNVLFWISGCGLLGVGLWLRIAYEGYASLLPQYALLSADSLAIVLGTVTFVFSFFACCGSWFQNRCMLITYFSLVVFIFVAEFLLGSLAFVYRDNLKHTLREELQNGLLHHYNMTSTGPNSLIEIWDNIQTKFGCCGVKNYEDWYMIDYWPDEKWVPDTCCLPANFQKNCGKIKDVGIYMQGCYAQINNFFIKRLDIIGFVGIMIAITQILAYMVSSTCTKVKDKQREGSLNIFEVVLECRVESGCNLDNFIEDKLVVLAHMLTTSTFGFTAQGFFEVDSTLLFTLIGSISYYVVVFIQLN